MLWRSFDLITITITTTTATATTNFIKEDKEEEQSKTCDFVVVFAGKENGEIQLIWLD